ncbi:MAG TPA: D-alanyl-D-alanine carboxypeptidase/D-alanyl-D-alanine-endopeptidase [Nocardioidaceae bacterium]|jgi:D-alanyl-D-alanine carboxypeptidase/D-alanyl-D-alanine-endopeptidase (penicillin-binding protein 4)
MSGRFTRRGVTSTATTLGASVIAVLALTGPSASVAPASASRAAPAADTLASQIDALLTDPRYDGSQVGVVVRDADTGATLYDHNGDERLIPASNTKLFTSTAALDLLGSDYRFRTTVSTSGGQRGSTVKGDLYLTGGGDPTTLASDYGDLAAQLRDRGVRTVRGNLVADDSFFDHQRLGAFWSWDDEPFYYSAQISGLTVAPNTDYDSGTVIVETRAGSKVGRPAQLTLVPKTHYVHVVNDAVTGAAGSDNTISVEREHGNNIIHVTGSFPIDETVEQDWSTVWEPTGYAADVFKRALRDHGIDLRGRVRTGVTPDATTTLATHESMTLGDMLIPWLKLSNNMHAEHIVKTIGAEVEGDGSWDAGLDAIESDLPSLGVDTDVMRMVDGSGLARADFIPPDQITNLLVAARSKPWFDQWYNALPIAGNPDRFVGGTLRSRMVGTPAANNLHGKTGSLTGVTALSGYVTDADGDPLVFSIVSNNYLSSPRSVEDALGVLLASYSADTGAVAPNVRALRPTHRLPADIECSWAKAC